MYEVVVSFLPLLEAQATKQLVQVLLILIPALQHSFFALQLQHILIRDTPRQNSLQHRVHIRDPVNPPDSLGPFRPYLEQRVLPRLGILFGAVAG
jgi:hypothetical protein